MTQSPQRCSSVLSLVLSIVVLAPVLAGCRGGVGRDSSRPFVLQFWAMGREGEVVQRLVDDFELQNPEIGVKVQQIPWSAAHEKLLTAFVGGTMPDIFQLGTTWVPEFVALNAAEPLQVWLDGSPSVSADDYFRGVMEANTIGSSLFALPWYVDTRLLFYRTDLLAKAGHTEPPRSWNGWVDAMAKIQVRQGKDRHAVLLPIGEWEMPVILALQLDTELLRDNDQYANFTSSAFRQAYEFYIDLFRRGFAPRAGTTQIANLYQDFANGTFCFHVTGPWNIGEFRRRLPPSMEGRWATAPMPGPGKQYPGASLAGGASLAIFRRSRQKEAAWKLIEFLSEPKQQVELYRLTGDLPARRSAWRDAALQGDPAARAFWVQLQDVRSTPRIPEWEQIAQKIAAHSEAAIRGKMGSEQALAALDRDVDRLLEKRRWLIPRSRQASAEEG